ncbi:MAG: [FeFe] hydrogenase, group A [Candidatus Woesearchaeota archaeon]
MKVTIDGQEREVDGDETILHICEGMGITVPTLCYHKSLFPEARCRMCLVDMDGKLVTACSTKPRDGAVIQTRTQHVLDARKRNLELMKPNAPSCGLDDDYEICKIYKEVGLDESRFQNIKDYKPDLGAAVVRDNNKCINCGRCVQTCADIQNVYAIDFSGRAHSEHVTPYGEKRLSEVSCIKCGQCIMNCPVGAIHERWHIDEVQAALDNPKKHVVAQTAPSIRAALGELFGMPAGTLVTGKMVSSLRRCGFDKVFDVNLGADITIMEEASEFLRRYKEGGAFPMITTCCPGWILMMEHQHHDLVPHMSTCKSPHEMLGMLIKTYYAEKEGLDPEDVVVVSIMPCTAKKFESTRPELESAVDYVLTTRELGRLVKRNKIDFKSLEDEEFDPALGIATGAATIFGAAGGVMEAALRTAYEFATGEGVEKLEFDQIRGAEGIKEGSIVIDGTEIKFACANGGANIKELLARKDEYHFIEMMACPGGCIGGGGQPIYKNPEVLTRRREALYQDDAGLPLRKSHENPVVKRLYEEYLGAPLSEKAEKLLHTSYTLRDPFDRNV